MYVTCNVGIMIVVYCVMNWMKPMVSDRNYDKLTWRVMVLLQVD